ncbi:Uma2 family endonuclease [Pseudonocardiaceae bacterium YIM PH 21723]|nr:Uma2 family endonuclease [Pseudonocardiaceae bacterium YIM PH 21723]
MAPGAGIKAAPGPFDDRVMISHSYPDHLLTMEEWEAIPEDTSRHYEAVDGVLHVAPHPGNPHQYLLSRLCKAIDPLLPAELEVLPRVEMSVRVDYPITVRCPDLVVVNRNLVDRGAQRADASDVLLVVEILNAGSVSVDRVHKLHEYAEAGIPQYWIAGPYPEKTIEVYVLRDGGYEPDLVTDDPATALRLLPEMSH